MHSSWGCCLEIYYQSLKPNNMPTKQTKEERDKEIVEMVEGMKTTTAIESWKSRFQTNEEVFGYNQALQDIINNIKNAN